MKRHVFLPDRTVSVEDGTVRDLDGTVLGEVKRTTSRPLVWHYQPNSGTWFRYGPYQTRKAAIAALLADPSCPTPGPNRYDRP